MKLFYIESMIFGKVCYGFRRNSDGIIDTIPDKAIVEVINAVCYNFLSICLLISYSKLRRYDYGFL